MLLYICRYPGQLGHYFKSGDLFVLIVSSHLQHDYTNVLYLLKLHTFSLVMETINYKSKLPFRKLSTFACQLQNSDILLCLIFVLNVATVLLDAQQLLVPSVKSMVN
jgi:hypothetical protein